MLTRDMTSAVRVRARIPAGAVAAAIVVGALASLATPAAAADTITVQGEAPATTSFTPGVTALEGASGGAALFLTTDSAPASGWYTATYQLGVPTDGYYTVDATTTKKNVDWASPGQYSVDGGDLRPLADAPEVADVSGLLSTYRLGTFALTAGATSLEIRVSERRSQPDTQYVFVIDTLTLTPYPVPQLAVEGETPFQTSFLPGAVDLPSEGASGGRALQLNAAADPTGGAYTATYLIGVPSDGIYTVDATTQREGVDWASPGQFSINGGEFRPVAGSVKLADVSTTLVTYRLDALELHAGTNTVTFQVTQRRSQPDTHYVYLVDRIALSPYPVPVLSVEGEAPYRTNFRPGPSDHSSDGASGGLALALGTAAEPPAGGYTATYLISAPTTGLYDIDTTTIPADVDWASPATVSIDGADPVAYASATKVSQVSDLLSTYRIGAVWLEAGQSTEVTFQVTQRRAQPDTNYTFIVDKLVLVPDVLRMTAVGALPQLGVFARGEDAGLTVEFNGPIPGDTPVTWRVTDYDGAQVAAGTATADRGARQAHIALGAGLPVGHYTATASTDAYGARSSGFAVLPPASTRPASTSPLGLDVAAAQLVAPADMTRFAQILAMVGVTWVRDRPVWGDEVNPAPGVFDFSRQTAEAQWLPLAQAAGLKTLGVFHSAPSWTRSAGHKLPTDLTAVYGYAKAAAAQYPQAVGAWEVWNETNIGFAAPADGPDAYAAVVKAAAIGYADSGADPLVATAGLAGEDEHYATQEYKNGVLDYVDAYAYHTHTQGNVDATNDDLPSFASQLTAAAPYGGAAKRAWDTESGIGLTTDGLPDARQGVQQARYAVTSTIQSLAGGTDVHFWFLQPAYREGSLYWSVYRSATDPMPALVAQSILTRQLGEGIYAGQLTHLPEGVRGYTFLDQGAPVSALWSPAPTAATLSVTKNETATVTTIMGASTQVTADKKHLRVQVGPDPVYVRTTTVPTNLARATASPAVAQPVTERGFTDAERIVVQPRWPGAVSTDAQTQGYVLPRTGTTQLTVEVYNFSPSAQAVQLDAAATGGWTVTGGGTTVSAPAWGSTAVTFTVAAGPALAETPSDLTITPVVGGVAGSPAVSELRPDPISLAAQHVVIASKNHVRLSYTNAGQGPRTITKVTWVIDGRSKTQNVHTVVAAGQTATFTSPKVDGKSGPVDYTATVVFADGTSSSYSGVVARLTNDAVTTLPERTVAVDGTLDPLPGRWSHALTGLGVDPDNLSGKAWVTWDEDHLYVSALVHDDTFSQPFGSTQTWRGDALQFAIAPTWPGETSARPDLQAGYEYALSLTERGVELYQWRGGAAGLVAYPAAVTRDDATGTTTYEVAVPWSRLGGIDPAVGTVAAVSIAIDDTDDGDHRGWVSWGDGILTQKNTALYIPVVFSSSVGGN